MFSKNQTMKYTKDYYKKIKLLREAINHADAILVGAGAGLSTSAGLTYSGERFQRNFPDFIEKYHFTDMYSATFYPYDSLEKYWAYMSRHIKINRYDAPVGEPYKKLLELIKDKDYFILTTNVDHQFQKSGFDKHKLFYTQGDYGLWQCSQPCHNQTYDNAEAVTQMIAEQTDLRIPTKLIPHCPKCGKPMATNLRCDNSFVQDDGWYLAQSRYEEFKRRHEGLNILYLELGVGDNTPAIIKYPFWQMTAQNPNATYACINITEAAIPREISSQSICVGGNIDEVLSLVRD